MATAGARRRKGSSPTPVPPTPPRLVFAAIDFGTSCSGYAFCFRNEPLKIYTNAWNVQGSALTTNKAPTTVLLEPNHTFYAFGFDAEEKYIELLEEEDNPDAWYYFQKFKMALYRNQNLNRATKIFDINRRPMAAMDIFAMVINNLKDRLMRDVQLNVPEVGADEIFWILTVPAIWSDSAKQFMREAANKAKITNDQLKLVLEPEAASIYCQAHCTRKNIQAGGIVELKPFPTGHKYIVADLGGGTADIATHEVLEDGSLREIHRATGDALGAERVNEAFEVFLTNLMGKDVMEAFKRDTKADFLELMQQFEVQKKTVKIDDNSCIRLRYPVSLTDCLRTCKNMSLKERIEKKDFADLVKVKRDKLAIDAKLIKLFFSEPLNEIIGKLKEIIELEKFRIDSLLLVGGFADSPYVRDSIKAAFLDIRLVKPEEAGLHVLKGAVLTVVRPTHISERIARYTYGFRVAERFDRTKHPPNLLERRTSGDYCSDIFLKCIDKGQNLRFGEKIRKEFGSRHDTKERKFDQLSTDLYRSSKQNPKYCTAEEECEKVGEVKLVTPEDGWPDNVVFIAEITVGEAELNISVINEITGETYTTSVDFLQD